MINNMVDVSEIEVLRGPQGTLFGRNTPAGAITVNSVKPDFDGSGFLDGGVGDYGLYEISGAKSLTLIDNVLAVRFTGFKTDRDGYVDAVGKDIQKKDAMNDKNRWGGRFQALYMPTEDLTLHFIADHSEVDEICCAVGNSQWCKPAFFVNHLVFFISSRQLMKTARNGRSHHVPEYSEPRQ